MPKFKETNESAEKVEETNEVKLPQEAAAPQQEVQAPQETTVAKGEIAAALKKETPAKTEVPAPNQETQTPQDTTVTTDDIAGALKKTNVSGNVSPRQSLKTDYSTVLWGKAADEVNQENKDINQFVQELEQKGLTPEQYLAQKRAEYAALDEPIRKEGQEPQETSVTPDGIAAALRKQTPAKTEVPAPQQEVQAPQETTVAKGDVATALKKETPAKAEVTPAQQEVQAPQETTVAKGDVATALKKQTPAKTEVPAPQQEVQAPQETTVAKGDVAAALKKQTPAKTEVPAPQPEVQTPQETTVAKGEIAAALKKEPLTKQEAAPDQTEVQASQETTAAKNGAATTIKKELDETDSVNLKFKSAEDIKSYLHKSLEKFQSKERKNNQKFLEYLQKNKTTIEELIQQPIEKGRNYSRYVTNIANLAIDAGISPKSAGTIAHRIAELHTLDAHSEQILNGSRLVEQEIDGGLEVDRVVVRKGIHHIKDFKPIHLSGFEKTEMGGKWVEYMSGRYGAEFREKIKSGKLLPMTTKMDPSIKHALKNFMRDDVRQYKNKLETYRVLYKNERKLDDAKVKVSVQPYYVF